MAKVSIIIVNWDGRQYLGNCLASVFEQSYKDFKVILVDNGSTDDSVEFVKKNYSNVEIITLDKNYGFAKANNIAMERALKEGANYIALLNNDTRADNNWLDNLVKVMGLDKKIGICSSKILSIDNPRILYSTGHIFKWGKILDRGHGEIDNGQYDNKIDVVGACAGACLYRKEMIEQIGLFDENFVTSYEDAEMSWRALRKGWKSKYVPTAIVYHHGGGTSQKRKEIAQKLEEQGLLNIIKTIRRHATFFQKIQTSFFWTKIAMRAEVGRWFKRNIAGGKPFFERVKRIWILK